MLELPSCILVDPTVARVRDIAVEAAPTAIVLTMQATPATALCPICGQTARRIHSHYHRTLADVSWALVPVRIDLQVRRFFCDRADCVRRIFTERRPTIMQPYARRTTRLAQVQQQIGVLVGGSAGAFIGAILGLPGAVDFLLDLIRRRRLPARPTPRVLGIDDWALRKGQRYGTILVDHERAHIVELLPDRTPESVSHWLREHPGIEIVTRDRAEAYAQAITEGAPNALQVADRWHLLKNVTDSLTAALQDHRAAITSKLSPPELPPDAASDVDMHYGTTLRGPSAADQRRQARAEQIHHLHTQGWSHKAISTHLQCHPKTVHRCLQRTLPLPARCGVRTRTVDPYAPYLVQRWNEGCHNASQLLREITPRGYHGGSTVLRAFVATLRAQSGMPARSRTAHSQPLATADAQRVPSSRVLAWLSTQPKAALDETQQAVCAKLLTVNETVATAVQLAQRFATMIRERQAAALEGWLDEAMACGIRAFRSLANGIRADLAAVRAALTVVWSNGRTEGSVNRLKCVRRQMYGRGKLDLLRVRLMST